MAIKTNLNESSLEKVDVLNSINKHDKNLNIQGWGAIVLNTNSFCLAIDSTDTDLVL